MVTILPGDILSATLFGKTRRAILGLLYSHVGESFYMRELVRAARVSLGAAERELRKLTAAGILRRTVHGNQVYYQANPQCPIFKELKSLVVKSVGVGDVLRIALTPLAHGIDVAFVYGSLVRGEETRQSDVNLMVIGQVAFSEVVSALASAQETLRREVNPAVYPPAEFTAKLAANHHFLRTVLDQKKLFLIGDERELARLAQKRMGHGTQKQSRGNEGPARSR